MGLICVDNLMFINEDYAQYNSLGGGLNEGQEFYDNVDNREYLQQVQYNC